MPEEGRRFEAGLRFRAIIQGARTASLGAIDYERATMGVGSGLKLSLAAFKLHCIKQLGNDGDQGQRDQEDVPVHRCS